MGKCGNRGDKARLGVDMGGDKEEGVAGKRESRSPTIMLQTVCTEGRRRFPLDPFGLHPCKQSLPEQRKPFLLQTY